MQNLPLPNRKWFYATLALIIGGVLFAPVRVVVGLLFAFFLPGYALFSAMFVHHRLSPTLKTTVSIVGSVTLLQIGGVLFSALNIRFGFLTWFMWIAGVSAFFGLIALHRRRDLPERLLSHLPNISLLHSAMFATALALVGLAYLIAVLGESLTSGNDFTQLWSFYTENGIEVGVVNHELTPQTYRLYVVSNGRNMVEQAIVLNPRERWVEEIPLRTIGRISVQLYLSNQVDEPYREVSLDPLSIPTPTPTPSPTPLPDPNA